MANQELSARIAATTPNPSTDLPTAIQRYLDGESLQVLAKERGITKEGLRKQFKRYMLSYTGSDQAYQELITQALVERIAEADERLEDESISSDPVAIARAREMCRFSRMDLERRRPQLYGPKQEISKDEKITIILNPQCDVTPYIDGQPAQIPSDSQVIDNQADQSSGELTD